jgi:Uncharacterized membrane protein (homolog of Drosophila rhomboid)
MSFGFPPKFVEKFSLGEFSQEQFLVVALDTVRALQWDIGAIEQSSFVAYTGFSLSSFGEAVKVSVGETQVEIISSCTTLQLFDYGKNRKNVQRFLHLFSELKTSLSSDYIAVRVDEIHRDINVVDAANGRQKTAARWERSGGFLSVFIPSKDLFVTPIIIDLNIAVFILMVISGVNFFAPSIDDMVYWGANLRSMTLNGQSWRLFTNCFLHFGVVHLLMNMYALLYIGMLLEPQLGRIKFASAYLLTGIVASTASLWWHPLSVSAGASGAIFGMYGLFLAMLTTNLIERSARKSLLTSIVIFVGYNLLNGMKGGVDNAAHIGGLISGLVIGYAYFPSLRKTKDARWTVSVIAGLVVAVALLVSSVVKSLPNDGAKYQQKMEEFASLEQRALLVFKMPEDVNRQLLIKTLRDSGIYLWRKSIRLVQEADRLDLPSEAHTRNLLIIKYCNLRMESFDFLAKSLENNDDMGFMMRFKNCNEKIKQVMIQLGVKLE